MGAKTEENVLKALAAPAAADEPRRTLLGRALPALKAVVAVLAEHPASEQVSIAGSARRYKETVRDLDIIATASDADALIDYFTTLDWVIEVVAKGSTKATVISHDGFRFDLRVVPPESYGNLLQHFTGSKDHNVALREAAVRKKLSVSEYSVTETETGEEHTFGDEEELYAFLGYAYIPPELRENCGELEAARAGELPKLVEVGDLRGDLHTHTHWSADGKNTLEEMVIAAIARGYEYYAITDHSHYLREGRLEAQAEEIAALQERVAPFRILRGVEVNIKADGTLDMSDEELATLDWVVASVHAAREKNPLERFFAAMENPYVHCIGHLTGRKLNKRPPIDIDIERVIEKALETKTFLEMNSQPDRLDLRDVHARAAREAGLKVVIDSDGHEIGAQDYVEFGVGQARRAWLTKADVVNTRTWKQIEKLKKRAVDLRRDGAAALEWAASYLERVGELPVLAQVEPGWLLERLPEAAPETGEPFAALLDDMDRLILPAVTHWQSPRFFAYFPNTASDPAILAELLTIALNQVGFLWRTGPALAELEERTTQWLGQLLGLPADWHGHIEDTASMATLTALTVARAARPDRRVIVCSEQAHSSIDKAARILELDVRHVPVDDAYRLRADLLDADDACAVVATVGTTSSTSADPLPEIAARKGDAWLHVDAAYAGSSWVCPEFRVDGVEHADSLVVNPHKWLLTGMPCSVLWTQRVQDFREAFSLVPEYLRTSRRRHEPERADHPARPADACASALGRASLLRARRPAGDDPRARTACRAVRGVGAR